jgi:hypothetical protein
VTLKPCPVCGKAEGELKSSEFASRFPWHVKCKACGFFTELVTLPGVAVKLWNVRSLPGRAGRTSTSCLKCAAFGTLTYFTSCLKAR